MTILRGAAFLVVVCATALAVGCGGSEAELSKDEYIKEFRALGTHLESTLDELDNTDFKSTKQLARALDRLGKELERIGAGTADLNAPEEVAEANDDLATAIKEFGAWFHDLAETIRTTPRADLEQTLEKNFGFNGLADFDISKIAAAQKINEAIDELNDKGYSFAAGAGQYDTTGPGDAATGKEIFSSAGCGGCHTLTDAGATGVAGPDLDDARPPYGLVIERVKNGQGVMPAFASQLSEEQIQDVAAYVSQSAGRG